MRIKILIFISSLTLLASCGGTKKTTGPTTTAPERVEADTIVALDEEMDTIVWTEVDKTSEYENAMESFLLEKKSSYSVKLLLPFEIARNNRADVNQAETKLGRMTHYYAGLKMALDQLEDEGLNMEVEVIDAESGNFDLKLRQCKDADLIIGPRNSDQLSVTANFGKANDILVVSPWKSGSKISRENPYFLQMKPGLRDHYQRIIEHAMSNFAKENIVLIGRKNKREDLTYFRFLQAMAQAEELGGPEGRLKEFYVNEDSLVYGETAFDSLLGEKETYCLILPHWSFSTDEDFVYNVARKLSGEKGENDITLYGMPILFESDKIKFELYRSLNMQVCRSNYVDRNSNVTQEFKEAYYKKFRDFPSDEAFEAYDMMLYLGRNLFNYGRKFHHFVDNYTSELLQTRFDIQKVFEPGDDSFEDIQYFQNKHLYILSFEDDRFISN